MNDITQYLFDLRAFTARQEVFIAILIPFFGDLLSLAGALAGIASNLWIPWLLFAVHFWERLGVWSRGGLVMGIFGGACVTVLATIISVLNIVDDASSYELL